MQIVNQPVRKKDAMQLVTGQPVYMDDMIPEDCLIVKLYSDPLMQMRWCRRFRQIRQ